MSEHQYSAGIYTLGCKVNQYESEAMAEELERQGVRVLSPSCRCDAYIINTCTVTAESDRKAKQFIRRAMAQNPAAYIVVTGCLAQTAADALASMKGVDAVVGNSEKMRAAAEVVRLLREGKKAPSPAVWVDDIEQAPFEPMRIDKFERTRAYVKIEDGCENRCTYCIIPNARGSVRSKAPDDVVAEVQALTDGGCREVVLTGIETASYGKDRRDVDLISLLERIDRLPSLGRVRLGSLDPSLIRPEFVRRLTALSSVAPHFHLSLQSGSSSVLARMRRKYNARQAMDAIQLLRNALPDVQFTTDVIVGFPGETEEEFAETVAFVKQARFLTVHIFPYSPRKGTPAATMTGQLPMEVKRRRLHELEAVAVALRRTLLEDAVASAPLAEVLFETYENGMAVGHTKSFLEVAIPSPVSLHGELVTVRLTHTDGVLCFGERASLSPNDSKSLTERST